MTDKVGFISHPECMVASGDCFTSSRCLAECKKRAFHQHQSDVKNLKYSIVQLELRILKLEQHK